MDYLQEAIRHYEKDEAGIRNLNLANAAAAIAQATATQWQAQTAERTNTTLASIHAELRAIRILLGNTEALPSIATSLAALVELSTGKDYVDTVGDGAYSYDDVHSNDNDFTDEADADMDVPF